MTEIVNRRNRARSTRGPSHRVGVLAAASVVAAVLPLAGAAGNVANAATPATACSAPSALSSDDALRGPADRLKDVRLTWNPVAGAAGYELEVSPDQDFTNNIFVDVNTVSTRYDVPPTVLKPSTYFWRVRQAGASCWSDDGGTAAPTFSVAWKEAPTITAGSGTVAPTDFHFAWSAVPEASTYEVEVSDATTGQFIGRCMTDHTSVSPYDQVGGEAERAPGACFGPAVLGFRHPYLWRVRGLDLTGTPLAGKPYAYLSGGVDGSQPKSGQHGPVQVTGVHRLAAGTEDPGAAAVGAGDTIAIAGVGFDPDATKDSVSIGGVAAAGVSYEAATQSLRATVAGTTPGGVEDVTVTVTARGASAVSAVDEVVSLGETVTTSVPETFTNTVIGPWSAYASFTQTDPVTSGGAAAAPSGLVSYQTDANGNLPGAPCITCADTPTLHWNFNTSATSYRVYVWDDLDQSSIDRVYETSSTWLTPRDALLDNQAGQAYSWAVQSCTPSYCNAVSAVSSFRKDSLPVAAVSPLSGATVRNDNVVLTWAHWQSTNGTGLAAEQYHVQIGTKCTFDAGIIDDALVDSPEYVNPDKLYADGIYYWRVQAIDASGSPLAWNAPNHTTNNCSAVPSFTLVKSLAGAANPNGAAVGSAGAAAKVVEAGDASVKKSGRWVKRSAHGATQKTALVTDGKKKQALTYTFLRRSVTVSYCTGPMDGYFSIYVDGKLKRTLNSYKPFTSCGRTFLIRGLSLAKSHKLVIQASDRKGQRHGSPQVVVDYLKLV